ncbi:FYVE, RhoGEF and PH domain-containing protein 6-like [Dunckerocampus dactyliophorus]|uniref:FYVE, RhoGEF and PH domain-containing protein 6-like n=1 Tax=Dunckerocampus dactyliophorus TaxID=161453 RepID=UPI0024069180|nr:FYVE, RhoGEF and PH domain-containing protein 6-like [Dunckerocampus dactyliophorus]
MKSGMHKPPLAPKPKLAQLQKTELSPSTPRKDALSRQSPGLPRKMKPRLAPKPSFSKLESKPIPLKFQPPVTETQRIIGLLNTQNGIQQENTKPNWDYIIPICLCSQKHCMCIRSSHMDKTEKDLEIDKNPNSTEIKAGNVKTREINAPIANGHLPNHKPQQTAPALGKNLNKNTSSPQLKIQSSLGRTWSNETNGNVGEHGQDPQEDEQNPRKPFPIPMPRKPKSTFLVHQEKVEEAREEIQEGRTVEELKVSFEGKASASSPSLVSRPAPSPRKKPYLTAPEKAPSPALSALQNNVEEEDLGWDSVHDMELSVDKEDEVEEREGRRDGQDAANKDQVDPSRSNSRLENQDEVVKVAPKKLQRNNSPMAWMKRTESPDEMKLGMNGVWPPEKTTRTSGKQRPRSFSGTDRVRSEGQRRNSFRKLLDLKLSVMMLPKLITTKGSQTLPESFTNDQDKVRHLREAFRPERIGLEQSVDGDAFCPTSEQDVNYENICHYEEIPDYENIYFGGSEGSSVAWQSFMYSDEGIYEEPEVYLDKNAEYDRSSAEVDDIVSDDDFMPPSSDEEEDEEDDSSLSSKEDPEQQEESASGPKKTKIHHIATEIMTSEKVFVDVLKLLHVDFREAVAKASHQSGKPVIEDRQLNQILYYLPQLYELNQDLLQELQNRLALWDENEQVADIFLKKGPYLKMYSTYIREFDKNVALLEEQSKKNPAFGAVVREFEASPRCANLALKHYLLKPIQRIPQYQLLLRDYLKNLSKDSADYKDTQAALAIVKEVANHANDIMKQGDNFQKLIQVQCSLNGHHEIVQPGRIFLKEGTLNKLSRKIMQPRMFFLFNDTLLYTTPVQSGQYKFNNMLSLAGMKVSKPSQEAYQNELTIESVERSFILSASSASERDEWLEAISTAINDYTKKKITFISGKTSDEVQLRDAGDGAPLGSKAPIWIPDPRTTMCMICTCEFTLTWRRHHCRACGKVVCQSCSSNKHCLVYLKNQLARVCDQCYLTLREQKSEEALSAAASTGNKTSFAFSRKQKRIPAALKEVSASTGNSSMSGYLQRSKGKKKQGKRLWFVIKDKVLYTYAASEDVAALESQPLLGFVLKVDSSQQLQFKLYHKNTLYYNFKADDAHTAQRWIDTFKESAVL